MDVWEVHLHAVFSLVCIFAHEVELARLSQLFGRREVDEEISNRGGIFAVFCKGTAR